MEFIRSISNSAKQNWIAICLILIAICFAYWATYINKIDRYWGSYFFTSYFVLLSVMTYVIRMNLLRSILIPIAATILPLLIIEFLAVPPATKSKTILTDIKHVVSGAPVSSIRKALNIAVGTNGKYTRTKTVRKTGAVIFKMNVSTNKWGFRNTSNSNPDGPGVIFLGGSNTFGWGVSDHQTLASQFGQQSGNEYRVVNLGIKGGGSNQILRALETGVLDEVIGKNLALFVHETSANTMSRIACKPLGSLASPKYILSEGRPKFTGRCFSVLTSKVIRYLHRRFNIFKKYVWKRRIKRNYNAYDAELFSEINISIARMVRKKYGVPSIMIYTRGKTGNQFSSASFDDIIIEKMRKSQIPLLDITLDHKGERKKYVVDGHATTYAHKLTAEMLSKFISQPGNVALTAILP